MGALTLKSFPFILRDWDIQSYDSINPTDSFGQDTKVYVNKNQVIKIEPGFSNTNSNNWLTDKSRQFFDGMFVGNRSNESLSQEKPWEKMFQEITRKFYVFDICNFKNYNKNFFVIVFENLSVETLNLIFLLSQSHSFIKVRRAESLKADTCLEFASQVNSSTCNSKLLSSSLCLLINTNTRYEGSYLNLKLRQRHLKGNFKLLSIGSFMDLTTPVSFIGSSLCKLQKITEGNSTYCADLVNATNPTIITNSETTKRKDAKQILNILKVLGHANIVNNIWNGLNVLNPSLGEAVKNSLKPFSFLTFQDLLCFNSFYVINANVGNIPNFKKATESRLLKFKKAYLEPVGSNNLCIDQSHIENFSGNFSKLLDLKKLIYLPSSVFFENTESFINTEGRMKRTTKLIFKKSVKNDWQLIRKLSRSMELLTTVGNYKDGKLISFNNRTVSIFKIFSSFQLQPTQVLTDLNHYLNKKNKPFVVYKKSLTFKTQSTKLFRTRVKYWLDDFYTGGKDRFCQNSLVLINCSKNYQAQSTNFF